MSAKIVFPIGVVTVKNGRVTTDSSSASFRALVKDYARDFELRGVVAHEHPDNLLADYLAAEMLGTVTERVPFGNEPEQPIERVYDAPRSLKELLLQRIKGGAGSGHHGHRGVPGQVGGSAPDGISNVESSGGGAAAAAKPKGGGGFYQASGERQQRLPEITRRRRGKKVEFIADDWTGLSMPDRLAKWSALSEEERDTLADAMNSVPDAIAKIVNEMGERPGFDGKNVRTAIRERMNQSKDFIHDIARDKIGKHVETLDGLLQNIRVNPEVRYKLAMEATDTLIAQEFEAMSRQIGDHGIHHIGGNIETTMMILDEVPGKDSDRTKAAAYIAQIFHDTGYLTGPSQNFMDNGHPRWGAEHYDANVRGLVAEALGDRWAGRITHMIVNHAGADVDWDEDLTGTAVRVADNLAVYHREKLPPLFRYNNGTLKTLADMHFGRIDIDKARAQMTEQVRAMGHPGKMEEALLRAVQEVSPVTGKFTLGMLGGYLQGVDWLGNHMRVNIQRNKGGDLLNQMLDLGQKQASKFAKSFGLDPAKFLESGSESLKDDNGNTVLELILHGLKEFRRRIAHPS